MFANLRKQPFTVILINSLIVDYSEAHIWLSERLASHVTIRALPNQFPGPLDDPAHEVHQRLVIREQQHAGRESHIFQIGVHLQSSRSLAASSSPKV